MKENSFSVGLNKGGRPPKYSTVESLSDKITDYFNLFVSDVENESIEDLDAI